MFVKELDSNSNNITLITEQCFCGATLSSDKANYGYCDECAKKRNEFVAYMVSNYNIADISAFEYIIVGASERLRVSNMTEVFTAMVDEYMLENGDLNPYENPLFIEKILLTKVELLEKFLDDLSLRDRDESYIGAFEFYYSNYETRIKNDLEHIRKVISDLREGIINPYQKSLSNGTI